MLHDPKMPKETFTSLSFLQREQTSVKLPINHLFFNSNEFS